MANAALSRGSIPTPAPGHAPLQASPVALLLPGDPDPEPAPRLPGGQPGYWVLAYGGTAGPGNAPRGAAAATWSPDVDLACLDGTTAQLAPAIRAIVDLYLAHRLAGERYGDCFARLGAPKYRAMLQEALPGRPGTWIGEPAAAP
jgi:hypothetical protein